MDELKTSEVSPWAERVARLDEPLRSQVAHELGRRVMTIVEGTPVPSIPKEGLAIKELMVKVAGAKPELKQLEPFLDFVVWASIHQGREGCFTVWKFGTQCFAPMLKLRRDAHTFVHMFVGYVIVDFTLGSFRGKASTDNRIREVCGEELARCPEELRPHYRAILAAIGDESALDALPALLKSEVVADWLYAHLFIERMFAKGSPYTDGEISRDNSDYRRPEQGAKVWGALNERILAWWSAHRERMAYDRKTGLWRAD